MGKKTGLNPARDMRTRAHRYKRRSACRGADVRPWGAGASPRAHYSEQNGDLMADPEIEFAVDEAEQTIEPVLFRNDYTGSYDEVYKEVDGQMMYSQRLRVNLDEFLHIWLKNLKQQGFIKLIKEM